MMNLLYIYLYVSFVILFTSIAKYTDIFVIYEYATAVFCPYAPSLRITLR
jgi:hypothetical protein